MKKIILFIIVFLGVNYLNAQKINEISPNEENYNLSPNGLFEKVFDHYGNSYNLSDIWIYKQGRSQSNFKATAPTPMTCGYYNLYFETGSGMEDISNPVHVERRNVLCRVITDLSDFINSPLTTNGLNNKVNIWVRNINNVITPPNSSNGVLGLASSFYTMPYNTTVGFGGIIDNEIWKTIHLGKDSYTNVISPLTSNGISAGQPGIFYHGMMAFNFSDSSINWNTNLTVTTFPNQYDLYSVVLHEMTHALGFASLINSNGSSKFNTGYNYYSRYDTRLKNNANTQFLINKQTNACGSMYNYVFNSALNTSVLAPSSSACNNKVRYVGLSNVPVHTPTTFAPPSSLHHFEGACLSPNPSFVMESSIGMNTIKRFLKPQERNVLGDIGYSVNNTFGVSSTYQGTTTYTGTISGISVAGMNDGINSSGIYTYSGNANTNIQISNFLTNDTNATGFECLEDIYHTSTLSTTSGTSSTIITFNSSEAGLHLLRYVPTNGTQKGNISYIYVYVISSNCTPNACNLINNGGFEESNLCGQMNLLNLFPDPTIECWDSMSLSPDVYKRNCTNEISDYGVPFNNTIPVTETWNDGLSNNNTMIGLQGRGKSWRESVQTQLNSFLEPNKNYVLSFKAKVIDEYDQPQFGQTSNLPTNIIIGGSNGFIVPFQFNEIIPPSITILGNAIVPNNNEWNNISININTSLSNIHNLSIINGFGIDALQAGTITRVFIDDVSIIETNSEFNLPENICLNELISDLSDYLDNAPLNGTFSGNGVSSNIFDSSLAGVGVHIITYTYTNSTGCSVSISSQIEVLSSNNPDCIDCQEYLIFSGTENLSSVTYNASDYIETNSNYLVNTDSEVSLKASNYIVIKPQSQVKSGAKFLARIENCDGTYNRTTNSVIETTNPLLLDVSTKSTIYEDIDDIGLRIYPNPSNGLLNITTNLNSELQISIWNMLGKEVINTKITNNLLDISHLPSGIYIVKVTEEGKIVPVKIVKL